MLNITQLLYIFEFTNTIPSYVHNISDLKLYQKPIYESIFLFLFSLAELECLFWGQYFSSNVGLPSPKKGLHMVTQKWSRTLQQLDIANQLFTEEDLEMAMSHLVHSTEADALRSLNLSGTRITPRALRYSLFSFPS